MDLNSPCYLVNAGVGVSVEETVGGGWGVEVMRTRQGGREDKYVILGKLEESLYILCLNSQIPSFLSEDFFCNNHIPI